MAGDGSAREQLRILLHDLSESVVCAEFGGWVRAGGPGRRHAVLSALQANPVCAFGRLMRPPQPKLMANNCEIERPDYLRQLPGSALGMLWPADRVGLGMMACRWLRTELLAHAPAVVLTIASPWDECAEPESLGAYLSLFKSKTVSLSYDQRTKHRCCQRVAEAVRAAQLERLQLLEVRGDWPFIDPVPDNLFSSLTHLSLRSCDVPRRGLPLWVCPSLTVLALSDCLLESFVLPDIAEIVAANPALTHLDLSKNRIGQQAMTAAENLMSLKACTTLTHLDLSSNFLGGESMTALAAVVTGLNLQRLYLSNNMIDDGLAIQHLMSCLEIHAPAHSVQHLDLSHCHLSRVGCEAAWSLLAQRCLLHLDWSGNDLSSSGGLDLLMSGVAHCPGLTGLGLHGCSISRGARAIASAIPRSLRKLDLGDNCFRPRHADRIVNLLSSLNDLELLDLGDLPLSASQQHILLSRRCTALTSLCLNGCGIGRSKLVRGLGDAVRQNSSLTHLDLGNSALGSASARSIFGVETGGRHVRFLHLGQNVMGTRAFVSVSKWLSGNGCLTHLDLSNNHIGSEGARVLQPLMVSWPLLEVLELGENGVQDDGVRSVVHGLQTAGCRRLRHLGLSGNGFGDCGVARLIPILGRNSQLRHLDLVQNDIGPEGGGQLATVLQRFAATVDEWHRMWVDVQGNAFGEDVRVRLSSLDPCLVMVPGFNCVAGVPGFDCRVAMRGLAKDREWVTALRSL